MRRILLILALLLLAGIASAQTLIGHNNSGSNASFTVTWSGTASLIYVSCDGTNGAPTDTLGLGWHAITANNGAELLTSFYAYGSFSGGTDTITCPSYPNEVQVFSGMPSFNSADGSNNNQFGGQDPGSLAPSQAGDLFISAYESGDGNGNCSSVSTGTIENNFFSSGGYSMADAYYKNSGSGAIDMVWTCTDGDDGETNIAAFKTSGSATKASNPSCTPSSGAAPQTLTCTESNLSPSGMCWAVSPATPATDGLADGTCTTGTWMLSGGNISVTTAETINIVAGTPYTADSSVVSYTYTGGSVKRHRASVVQR